MTREPLPHPGVWFPPPLAFVAGVALGLLGNRWRPIELLPGATRVELAVVAGLFGAAWVAVTFSAIREFRRAGTTLVPNRPAARLVESGIYRFSRNPMYLGLTILYLGTTIALNTAWPLFFLPLVIAYITRGVIRREERYLHDAFGEAYDAYCARVRRWL